jgi:hypothetical protein
MGAGPSPVLTRTCSIDTTMALAERHRCIPKRSRTPSADAIGRPASAAHTTARSTSAAFGRSGNAADPVRHDQPLDVEVLGDLAQVQLERLDARLGPDRGAPPEEDRREHGLVQQSSARSSTSRPGRTDRKRMGKRNGSSRPSNASGRTPVYETGRHRARALRPWQRFCNHRRPHGALGHQPPASRLPAAA